MPRTILLTGATGVVGQALLDRLLEASPRPEVIALTHRRPVVGRQVTSLRGDVSVPRLGLADDVYTDLARRVDVVVHCAAVTDFNRTDGSLESTNVAGTRRVLELTQDAGATLHHVSTAFVNTTTVGERGQTAVGYARSKSAAEALLRSSGIPHVVHRPSVVIGDSVTGDIAAFQGLHQVVAGMYAGLVPMIPFDASWPIDFVPCDLVADAIASVVEAGVSEGEFWITAGDQALRLDEAVDVAVETAAALGTRLDRPAFVPPELFDRLIGPVFLDELPPRIRSTVLKMLEFFATYLQSGTTMRSSLAELEQLGMAPLPDQRESLAASVHHWADTKGFHTCESTRSVA